MHLPPFSVCDRIWVRIFRFMPEDGGSATIKLPAAPKLSWRRRKGGRSSPSNSSARNPAATRCCQSVTTCTPWDSPMESVFHTNQKKRLLSVLRVAPLLLLLNAATSAEEKNSQCHNYAGGHVYPGEAFRVPVSDHSLHLSKAKSEFCRHESICGTFKLLVASVDARLFPRRLQTAAAAWGKAPLKCTIGQTLGSVCIPWLIKNNNNNIYSCFNAHVVVVIIHKLSLTWFCWTRHTFMFSGLGSSGSPPPFSALNAVSIAFVCAI